MQTLLLLLCSLAGLSFAQFQFFEHMFNQGGQPQHQQHQQQQQQNVPSNSEWYQKNYEAGTRSTCHSDAYSYKAQSLTRCFSTMLELPLPCHAGVRALPTSLPVPVPSRRG